MRGMIYHT